ncbi:MAG: hypothetical protein AAF423_09100 [Pseudomonadota bacterium]
MSNQEKSTPTDLVVLIDTSGSMKDEAGHLSRSLESAIKMAEESCAADLRHCCFGIEGTWDNTHFSQSYRNYLLTLHDLSDADFAGDRYTGGKKVNAKEDGAGAIQDIARYFDWRDGALRTIFYLGDEGLKGGDPRDEKDERARDRAIAVAKEENIMVFTYLGTPLQEGAKPHPENVADYRKLAFDTGGDAYKSPNEDLGGFEPILESIICRKPLDGGAGLNLEHVRPGETWRPSNEIQLDLINIFEEEQPLDGKKQSIITCINTGTVTLRNIVLAMSLDDHLDSFEAVFADTSDDSKTVKIPDLEPGEHYHFGYDVDLIRDDPSYQPSLEKAYRLRIRPSFKVDFEFSQAAHYNVGTLSDQH